MISKQSGVFYFTFSLLVAVCTAFFIIDCPFLAINVSKSIPIIGGILFLFSVSTLLRTSFSDPGGKLSFEFFPNNKLNFRFNLLQLYLEQLLMKSLILNVKLKKQLVRI